MIFFTFAAAHFKGMTTSFEQADKAAFLFVLLADVIYNGRGFIGRFHLYFINIIINLSIIAFALALYHINFINKDYINIKKNQIIFRRFSDI